MHFILSLKKKNFVNITVEKAFFALTEVSLMISWSENIFYPLSSFQVLSLTLDSSFPNNLELQNKAGDRELGTAKALSNPTEDPVYDPETLFLFKFKPGNHTVYEFVVCKALDFCIHAFHIRLSEK